MSYSIRKRTWTNKGKRGEALQVDIAFTQTDGTPFRRRFNFVGTIPNAKEWAGRAETKLRQGLPVPQQDTTTTEGKEEGICFRGYAETYMATHGIDNKPSGQSTKASILKKWLVPEFGDQQLAEITSPRILVLRTRLRQDAKLSPKRTNNILTVLGTILRQAADDGLIKAAPKIIRLKVKEPDIRGFSEEEEQNIQRQISPALRVMLLVALRTGMRIGELRGLRWRDVDLRGKRVHVRQAYARSILGTPKGNRSRTIDLSDQTVAALSSHPRHEQSEYVFPRPDGSHMGQHDSYDLLHAASDAAGIVWTTGEDGKKTVRPGWHTCRHTFISRLVQMGVPLNVVQALAGHATIRETMRYAHLAPSATWNAVALLDGGTKSQAQGKAPSAGKPENEVTL